MNAFNTVDLAGACILVSLEFAEDLGVPRDKWIYPLGGAGTRDSYDCELEMSQSFSSNERLTLLSLGTPKLLQQSGVIRVPKQSSRSISS